MDICKFQFTKRNILLNRDTEVWLNVKTYENVFFFMVMLVEYEFSFLGPFFLAILHFPFPFEVFGSDVDGKTLVNTVLCLCFKRRRLSCSVDFSVAFSWSLDFRRVQPPGRFPEVSSLKRTWRRKLDSSIFAKCLNHGEHNYINRSPIFQILQNLGKCFIIFASSNFKTLVKKCECLKNKELNYTSSANNPF